MLPSVHSRSTMESSSPSPRACTRIWYRFMYTHVHTRRVRLGYCPITWGSSYSTVVKGAGSPSVMKGAGSPVLHTVIQPEMVNRVNDFPIRGYEKIESNKYIWKEKACVLWQGVQREAQLQLSWTEPKMPPSPDSPVTPKTKVCKPCHSETTKQVFPA